MTTPVTTTLFTRVALLSLAALPALARSPALPSPAAIDAEVHRAMDTTHSKGMAIAVIDHGAVKYVQAYGVRNAAGDPLQTDTVMYGASITKTVVAYTTLQLVDQGKLKLDTPLADDLDKPLTEYDPEAIYKGKYGPYGDLASDPRWRQIERHLPRAQADDSWKPVQREIDRVQARHQRDAASDGVIVELAHDALG